MATYYCDALNGSDSNDGSTEALAKQTLAAGCALLSSPGDILYVQAGADYVLTSSITLNLQGSFTSGRYRIEGYTTTPGARDGRPTITSSTNSLILFNCAYVQYFDFVHLHITHTASTRGRAFESNGAGNCAYNRIIDCVIDGCANGVVGNDTAFTSIIIEETVIKNCTGTAIIAPNAVVIGSQITNNSGYGISFSYGSVVVESSIFSSNTNYAIYDSTGVGGSGSYAIINNSAFYNNSSDGIRLTTTVNTFIICNNIFYGNVGVGLNLPNVDTTAKQDGVYRLIRNNAYGSNSSGNSYGVKSPEQGVVSLSGDPFTNAAAGDFSLNNTAGAGAACRAAAFPGVLCDGNTTGYLDIGVAQHQDSGGGGTVYPIVIGG